MKCTYHKDRETRRRCEDCGLPICGECEAKDAMKVLCALCHGRSNFSVDWQPHSIFAFGLSLFTFISMFGYILMLDTGISGTAAFISFLVVLLILALNIRHTRKAIKKDDLCLVTMLSAILTIINCLLLVTVLFYLALKPEDDFGGGRVPRPTTFIRQDNATL